MRRLWRFGLEEAQDEGGATAVEYGLMVALIAGAIIVTVAALGDPVMGLYARVEWW
jgi:pilus assembly protein Flp/PilA